MLYVCTEQLLSDFAVFSIWLRNNQKGLNNTAKFQIKGFYLKL